MKRLNKEQSRGFTLLEVLVAMAIFAVIGLGANTMLRTMVDTHERTLAVNESMARYTRVMGLIERDFSQLTLRPVRDEYGEPLPFLMVGQTPYPIEFTRAGWNNPASLPRSNLQRVGYRVEDDGVLTRYQWLVLDRAEDSEPISQELLSDVVDFRVNAFDAEGNVTDSWPGQENQTLPTYVEVLIDTRDLGQIRRVISLVAGPQQVQGGGPAGGGLPPADGQESP